MVSVTAIRNFDHYGPIKKGDPLTVSRQEAEKLKRNKLVTIDGEAESHPTPAAGTRWSASPAARVSLQTIVRTFMNGSAQNLDEA